MKNVKVRKWKETDIDNIVKCHKAVYDDYSTHFGKRIFTLQQKNFPDGQFLIEVDGQIVGYSCSIIVQLDSDEATYTYDEITGRGSFSTHYMGGDTLYGADIGIIPEYRSKGLVKLLYEKRIKIMKKYNLKRMVAHGRIPGFMNHAGKMNAEEYVEKVSKGKLKDPALSSHLKVGYKVKSVLLDFVKDNSSMNYATWLVLKNSEFDDVKRQNSSPIIKKSVRKVRICAGQWELKKIASWDEFVSNVTFFIDTATVYHSHFLLLPEFFSVQLFSLFDPNLSGAKAMKLLSEYTDRINELMSQKAKAAKLYIIGGSTPVMREDGMYNVSHLYTPTGKIFTQDKLHITPGERKYFDILPGEGITVFDTQYGKIAIQICYDVEFPEVTRLLTLAGVEILFVPFSTDERKAYNRVRNTSFARAIENYIYVAIAGNVGNLPVKSYPVNYGQAAIITPSDIAFPTNALEGEADPNVETVVVADVDLSTLHAQREVGSVRPLFDRRDDLYELKAKTQIKVVKAY